MWQSRKLTVVRYNKNQHRSEQMIPHRALSNELTGSGLRDRVTACRKRLREHRVMLKAHAAAMEELFPEARLNCSPGKDVERAEAGALLQIEEQEVGIT
jgi:hypothetical protein